MHSVAMWSFPGKLIPERCVFCGVDGQQRQICADCDRILPWNHRYCELCGQPVPSVLAQGVTCSACQRRPPAYYKARSPLRYDFPVDTALKAMKFRHHLVYVPVFSRLMQRYVREDFSKCDALVAVPLHRWRHVKRGFNQAAELCNELTAYSGLPVVRNVIRVRPTKTQSGLTSAKRKQNLRNAFTVRGRLAARYPLVIDDVITTGATCDQLSRALLAAGAERVGVLTVARASLGTS